ncbi:uncharacterized protein JCM15063_002095 [Sporobolomyces koalae]|uniref:uncharacterized protein n=1 Tax=Sporobolomyces koalae TaxID=500713 RepID=UPI00316C3442
MNNLASTDSNSFEEKGKIEHAEYAAAGHASSREDDPALQVSDEFKKQTIKKIDRRLLIILSAIYAVSLIDRTNISVARVAGMAKDLKLTVGERYSIITLIFFVPYIIFELPAALLSRKIGPRALLSTITILWGSVMLGMAFVKNWEQLLACRFLLGLLESGFFPSCVYLISCWYTRHELQKRMSFFYLTSMVISGFSNIIGYGMSRLGGKAGLAAWRWIFLLFGIITIVLGVLAVIFVVDFPDRASFLKSDEREFVQARVNADRGDAEADKFTLTKAFKHATDLKLWAFGLIFCFSTMPAYAFSYFLPVILAGGGYDTKLSLCLSAPPYVFAAMYTFASAVISDKRKNRAVFIAISACVCFTGLFIMAYTKPLGVRYFGSFLVIAGAQSNVPAALTYSANNVRSHSKRAVTSAITVGLGGVGGIFASLVFRQKDYPLYLPGMWATIGCQFGILVLLATLTTYFRIRNGQADRGERVIEGSETFRYTL